MASCEFCDAPAITELDGDVMCRDHADAWVRCEGRAVREAQINYSAELRAQGLLP